MIPPGCEARCPGCAHRELSPAQSQSRKAQWLSHALGPWHSAIEALRAPHEDRRLNYREKTLLHAVRRDSRWEFGLRIACRGQDGKDEVIPIPRCPIHSERVRRALAVLSESLAGKEFSWLDLRFVAIAGPLLTLIVKASPDVEPAGPGGLKSTIAERAPALRDAGISGVFVNFNPAAGRRVFSSRGWKHVWGDSFALGAGGLRHGPQSFQQLIPELFEDALSESAIWLQPGPGDFVLDLYTGLGASLRKWQAMGAESVGVELLGEAAGLFPDAVLRGRASERIPQLEARLLSWRRDSSGGAVTAFVNPPRIGLEPEVIDWLGDAAGARPRRVAYLSCSAGTLRRDLSKLEIYKYRVKRIIPYDFFPQTAHVETLALLELDRAFGVPHSHSRERLRRAQ